MSVVHFLVCNMMCLCFHTNCFWLLSNITFSFLRRPGPDPVSDCRAGGEGWTVRLCWWPTAVTVPDTSSYYDLLSRPILFRWSNEGGWDGRGMCRCGEEKYIQGFVWIPPRKEPLTRLRSRWQCTFKMDLKATGCGDVNWILLVQDRNKWRAVDSTVMNRLVP